MASLSQINIKFKADLSGFSTEMQNVGRQMEQTGAKLQDTGSKMTLALTAPLGILGGLALKTAADFETMRTSLLSTFQGNQQAADAAFQSIQKFAESTPFQMEEVLEAFIKLKNMGLDPSEEAVTSYGNTASAMGKSLNQMIEAVADAATGEFERLKEFGIKSKSEGDKVSFTFQGVTTTVAKNSEEIQKYLLGIGNVNFAGGMERQSQTFNGQISTLKDSFASLSDEFGTIIIEMVKPLIAGIKNMADGFKTLSPEVKKTIVIVGGLVAAVGPLLLSTGLLVSSFPTMVAGLKSVRDAIVLVTTTLSANPWGLLAIGIAGVIGYLAIAKKSLSDTVESVNEMTSSVVKQRNEQSHLGGELDKMLSRYEQLNSKLKLNKEEQTELNELIVKIGQVVPEAITQVNKYGEALSINAEKAKEFSKTQTELFELKAKKALQENIDLQKKLLQEQKNLTISESDLNAKYVEGIGYVQKRNDRLQVYNRITGKTRDLTLDELILFKERVDLNERNLRTTANNIKLLQGQKTVEETILDAEKTKQEQKARTIAIINAEIEAERKLIDEQSTNAGVVAIKNRISALETERDLILGLQKEREKLQGISIESKGSDDSIVKIQEEISRLKQFQNEVATTSELWKMAQQEIEKNEIRIKIKQEGVESLFKGVDEQSLKGLRNYVDTYQLEAMRLELINQQLTEGISQIYTRAANDIAVGLGELIGSASSIGGFVQGMGQLLLGSFGDILIEFGKLAIQTGIGIETVKTALASFSGVGAIAIGVGLVALGSFVKSQSKEIANAPRFETGGVVGGSSYYGDKILARVNSGELILNDKQQRRLSGMMDSANNAINVVLGGGFEVSGDKLRLVLDRSNDRKKRLK